MSSTRPGSPSTTGFTISQATLSISSLIVPTSICVETSPSLTKPTLAIPSLPSMSLSNALRWRHALSMVSLLLATHPVGPWGAGKPSCHPGKLQTDRKKMGLFLIHFVDPPDRSWRIKHCRKHPLLFVVWKRHQKSVRACLGRAALNRPAFTHSGCPQTISRISGHSSMNWPPLSPPCLLDRSKWTSTFRPLLLDIEQHQPSTLRVRVPNCPHFPATRIPINSSIRLCNNATSTTQSL